MANREDLLLGRWCSQRDVDALGQLFDLAAPKLLKVAIHLMGDASEAEDLVQQTFLALIEQRERIDVARPALPWLVGVLTHKAGDAKRRAARPIEADRLQLRAVEEADAPLERRELSGELARAVDALEEPYRAALVLRLRHGMGVADIAHALGRSPGTVRVQLHRAHEKLRRHLPPSLVSALALDLGVPQGLPAVKAVVLQEATIATAAAATVTSALGVWIVSQKLLLAAAGLVALVAFVAWRSDTTPVEPSIRPEEVAQDTVLPERPEEPTTDEAREPSEAVAPAVAGLRQELVEPTPAAATGHFVSGFVTDAATGAPIEGAEVGLFAPRQTSLFDVLRERPELFTVGNNGLPRARTRGDWPYLGGLSDGGRFGNEPVDLYAEPADGAEALVRTFSGRDGSFQLPADAEGGLLVASHADYGRRMRAAIDPSRDWSMALGQERVYSGKVIMPDLSEPGRPLRLAFSAMRVPPVDMNEMKASAGHRMIEDHEIEGLGIWTAETRDDGTFEVRVSAREVMVHVLEPGLNVQSNGPRLVGAQEEQTKIFLEYLPLFRFLDARTDAPIEHVRLLARERSNGYVKWSGAFDTPDGYLTLPGGASFLRWYTKETFEFQAWAEGYEPATANLSQIDKVRSHEFRLEPGEHAGITGSVRRGSAPCTTAHVGLMGRSPLQWNADDDFLVDGARVDERGRFRLSAAAGTYILRVSDGAQVYFEQVVLPLDLPLDLDLDATGRIEVTVVDTAEQPQFEHVVALQGTDGRSVHRYTDEQGKVSFTDVSPGEFRVLVPHVTTKSSFSADDVEQVNLERGEHRELLVEIPADRGPRFPRLVVPGAGEFEGWRARYAGMEWTPLEPDGRVPLDINVQWYSYEFAAPDQRRWELPIPKEADDGHVLQLDAGNESYAGKLMDGAGEPLKRVRVFGVPWAGEGRSDVTVSAVTNARGEFRLDGLQLNGHRLYFHQNPERERNYDYDSNYKGTSYRPREMPGDDVWLEIRLPRDVPRARTHGIVKRASDGSAVAERMMYTECFEPGPTGDLLLGGDVSFTTTDAEGRFEYLLPRTSQRTYRVYGKDRTHGVKLTETRAVSKLDPEPEVELIVP